MAEKKKTAGEVLYMMWCAKHPACQDPPLYKVETWDELDSEDQEAWEGLALLVGRGLLSYAYLGAALFFP